MVCRPQMPVYYQSISISPSRIETGDGPHFRPPRACFLSTLRLEPHPATPCSWINSVTAAVTRDGSGSVTGRYVLGGDIQQLRIPPAAALPVRTDGLWRTTCFELFTRASAGPS